MSELARALALRHPAHSEAREQLCDVVAGLSASEHAGPLEALSGAPRRMGGGEPEVGDPSAAHVLLHGPAGVGKTHLALAVADLVGGRMPVRVRLARAKSDAAERPIRGLTIWISRDAARPAGAPRQLVRIAVRSLSSGEKTAILRGSLLPELCDDLGVDPAEFEAPDAMAAIVRGGAREAGFHGALSRAGRIARRLARERQERATRHHLDRPWLGSVLGADLDPLDPLPGVLPPGGTLAAMVSGWGGDFARVEARALPGRGKLLVTGAGPLAETAAQVARTRLSFLGPTLEIEEAALRTLDWHVHVSGPEGPKDGASLGWPVLAAMASFLAGRALPPRTALTGELALDGSLLPVGEIVEKCLGAERAGLATLSLPRGNVSETAFLPPMALGSLSLRPEDDDRRGLLALGLGKETA